MKSIQEIALKAVKGEGRRRMKSIQEIAKQAAVDYLKFKLGDRKGFNVYDIDASDADELIAEIEQECAKSFMDFLAAVDAERGKDAVCHLYRDMYSGGKNGVLRVCRVTPNDDAFPVFRSPTIPEGWKLLKDTTQEDYFADACRLALELECLLLDTKDTAAASKWWESAIEALDQHRERIEQMRKDVGHAD